MGGSSAGHVQMTRLTVTSPDYLRRRLAQNRGPRCTSLFFKGKKKKPLHFAIVKLTFGVGVKLNVGRQRSNWRSSSVCFSFKSSNNYFFQVCLKPKFHKYPPKQTTSISFTKTLNSPYSIIILSIPSALPLLRSILHIQHRHWCHGQVSIQQHRQSFPHWPRRSNISLHF